MSIDLGSKPEGATHISPYNGLWIKYLGGGGGHYQFFKNGQWEMGFGCMSNSYLEIAQPEPWTGEGLPPVGTVCEWRHHQAPPTGKSEWHTGDIRYISDFTVVIGGEGCEHVHHPRNCSFRPIRTAEQIAAEERKREIEEIRKVSCSVGAEHEYDFAIALYAAGYRKQVAK